MMTDFMSKDELVNELKKVNNYISDAFERDVKRNINVYHREVKRLKKLFPEQTFLVITVKKFKCPTTKNTTYVIVGYDIVNKEFICSCYGMMTDRNGKRQLVTASFDEVNGSKVFIYSSHLLSRYRERYLGNREMDFDELVKSFIKDTRNGKLSSRIHWNFKRKSNPSEKTAVEVTTIGCNMGEDKGNGWIIFKTFVPKDQLKELQEEYIHSGDIMVNIFDMYVDDLLEETLSYFGA